MSCAWGMQAADRSVYWIVELCLFGAAEVEKMERKLDRKRYNPS